MTTKKILFGSTLLAAAAMSFCATSVAFAADVTWTGASGTTSGDETIYKWGDEGNWDSGSATWTGSDDTKFTNDATNTTVTVDGTYIANSLTISGGSYTFKYTDDASLTVGSANGGSNLIIDGVEGTSLTVTGGTNAFNKLYVGRYSYGELTIKDGTNTFGSSTSPINTNVYIGAEEGGTGVMTIEGGTNDFMGAVYVGNRGTGTLTIEDGTNTFHDDNSYGWALVVGSSEGTTGTMTISGGENTFNVSVDVGYSGTGTMTISGGKNTFNKSLVISRNENSSGTFTITSGTNTFYEDIYVACGNPDLDSTGGTGTMTIEGGTNTFKDIVWIGNNGKGTFELKGGINEFSSDLRIGDYNQSGVSKMTISGGTNTFEAGTIYIGYDGTVTRSGTLEITGGTNTFGSDTTNITISVGGSEAVGTFTISGGTNTINGSVTIAASSSATLTGGTISLSEAITNSGTVEISEDVVFVLNDSLLTVSTYTLITNTDGGTITAAEGSNITGWSDLTIDNFVDANGNTLENVVLDFSSAGQVKLLTSQGGVVIDYEYKTPWQRGDHGLSGYEAAEEDLYYFEAIKFDVSGVNATDFTLQDADGADISGKNVYIVGDGKDSSTLTITDIKVDNTSAGYYAFVVENATVVINGTGVKVDELGMSLCIGTMDSAELRITGGAQVSTSGYWSTIGSNMATGTLTISGEGSSLSNWQINIGMAVTSLSGGANEEKGDGYYFGRFVQTDEHYNKVIDALTSDTYQPTDGSYGIVNVLDGGTWKVGGSKDTSISRLQLSNGEINIDGEGSQLIFADSSSLVMGNMSWSSAYNYTAVSETLRVTNGGSADGEALHEAVIGGLYYAATSEAAIYVDGEGSTFDLSVDGYGYIGYVGSNNGGSEKVTISATDGGTFKLSTANGTNVAYVPSSYASSEYSMNVSFTAESGGTITLAATEDGATYSTYFGRNTATEKTSTIDVTATGEGSSVVISTNKTIYTNYNTSNFNTSFVAENGGSLSLDASVSIYFGNGENSSGSATVTANGGTVTMSGGDIIANDGNASDLSVTFTATNGGNMELTATSNGKGYEGIHLNSNSSIIVENGSTLTTSSAKTVLFESGSSISVDATSSWTDYSTIEVKAGAKMDLAGTVTISDTLDSQGAITVSDGTLDVKSISVTKAEGSGETDGVLTIAGGETTVETLTIGAEEDVGGSLSMTGGTLNVDTLSIAGTASVSMTGGTLNVSVDGTFSIASTASASFSGGTVNVSTAIANDGAVTVNGTVVFVLNDSLKVEGTSATYAIIINGEGGKIDGWQELTTSNFTYSNSALDSNVVLDLNTDGYVTLLYKEEGVTINYDYAIPWQRGTHGLSGIEESKLDLYYFRAMHIEIDEGASVGGFTLSDANGEAITSKNVYITGSGKDESKLTITDINVNNSDFKSSSEPYYAFVVENATVVINGTDVKVDELGMSLCIGTMESAELQITGGAQVSTSGVWSTIGSNMATGTVTISGAGSLLSNWQINIGMAVSSLSGMSDTDAAAGVDGYYYANYIETDADYYAVIAALASETYKPTAGSYGIVNVKEGGTWIVGGGDTSNSRLQFSNGEINIDGEGSSLIFGKNSSLVMENMTQSLTDADDNSVTLTVSETLRVTDGGSVKNADDVTLNSLTIGAIYSGSNGEAAIYVDGEGSSFDLSVGSSSQVRIGYKEDSIGGGTEDVKISATNGSEFKISAANGIRMGWTYTGAEQADSINVSFSAESGGLISLVATSGKDLYFGQNTATTEAKSSVEVKASGSDSRVEIISESGVIWTNYNTSNFDASFVAEDGGSLTLAATSYICLGYGSGIVGSTAVLADGGTVNLTGTQIVTNNNSATNFTVELTATNGGTMTLTATSGGISFNKNTTVTVDEDSSLTLSGAVTLATGATMDLAGTETISDTLNSKGAITVSDGTLDAKSISVTKAEDSGETDGTFTISGGTVSVETLTIGDADKSLGGSFSITSGEIDANSFSIDSSADASFSGGIVDVATSIADSGSVTVTNEVIFVLSDALKDENDQDGNTYIVIATENTTIGTWQGLSSNNFIIATEDGYTTLGRAVVDLSTDGVVTITDKEESATLIWNGKDSLHEWDKNPEDKDWKNGPLDDSFYMGDNVIFNEVAENKDVLIDETLIAGTITVEVSDEAETGTEIDYIFDFDNKASLEGESLSVGDGASLTVTGDGSLEIDGDTDIAGDMTVTGGAEANFDDGITIEDSGSLTVTSDEETGASGSVNVSGDLDVNGSLSVEDGSLTAGNLTLSKGDGETGASAEFSGGETTIDGTVSVDENSSLTVDGGTLTADSVEVEGTLDFEGGTLNTGDLTIASDENTTLKGGNLNIGSLTVTDDKGVTFGDGLTVGAYGDDGLDLDLDINLEGSVGFDTSNGDITIEGTISDGTDESGDKVTGSLTKTGSGTLTLDGTNDYSGGTTIDEGTIDAENTDALGTGEVDIHKGATLKIHSHGSTSEEPDSFSNSTTGEGTLEIADGSDIHFTEDVGVQNVVVDKGATLDGNTTLTHSDASLDLKGTLEISVGNEEVHISDSGKVILEDTSKLVLDDAEGLGAGDSFVIVDGGTVTGDIDSFLGTDSTLSELSNDYAVIYDTSNGLSVSIENTGTRSIPNMRLHDGLYSDFIAAVITEEDMTIVAGIQGTGDVSSNPIARELLNGNVSRAVEMLNTLAPNDYAAMIAMPTTAYHNDISSLDKRLAAVRAMPFSEDENARWGYFAQADGTFAENDDANDTPTFDFQLYGVLAGADYRMSNTLTVGVALGYDHEHAKLHNSGGRIDGDDVRLTIYAGTQITDTVYANVGAQVGYGHYEARRHTVMGRASGETDGYNAGVFADIGMDLPLSEKHGISARPYVGLAYLRSFVSGFDDSLFDIGSFNNDSLMARIGLGVFWDLGGVSLGLDTSFTHDFCGEEIDDMSATYRATGSKFYMMAECVPEDVFSVGPVVSVGISEGISAFAGYSFQAGSNEYIGHNVYIGVRASF